MAMTDEPILQLRGIRKSYPKADGGEHVVLDRLDLDVLPGQFVAIRGESGCGKSTLLRILGLVDNRYSGSYRLAGETVRNGRSFMPWSKQEELRAHSIGFIFQEDRLLNHLDVHANIELPMRIHGRRGAAERQALEQLITTVYRPDELDDEAILSKHRKYLSGGQRQRAAILRALASEPLFLLADEPTASLDQQLKEEVFSILDKLCAAGRTIVVVSHDRIFDNAHVVYEMRDGRLQVCHHNPRPRPQDSRSDEDPAVDEVADDNPEPGPGDSLEAAPEVLEANRASDDAAAVDDLTAQDGPSQTPENHAAESQAPDDAGRPRRTAFLGWLRSLVPRTSLGLQLTLAARDLFRSWLFTLLALGALVTGAFQLTLLWSLEAGTRELLDELIRQGSRLNRINVSVQADHLLADDRLPDRGRMLALPGVQVVVPRREGIYRVRDRRGRERFETVFGLAAADPELEKLVFTAGSGFSSESALEVVVSERNIPRLFEVPDAGVSDQLRRDVVGRQLRFAVARPPAGVTIDTPQEDIEMEVVRLQLRIAGVVARAESDRNFYLPRITQLLLEKWRLDERRTFELPLNETRDAWTLDDAQLSPLIDFPWEERALVYLDNLDQVIPAHREIVSMGYEARAEIFNYQWVIHTRRLANLVISGLVGMVLLIAGMVIAGNIAIGVQLRLKEIVLLKLLGMRNGDISVIYIWNAIMAALVGTLIGFYAGSLVVKRLREFVETNYQSADFARLLGPTDPFFGKVVLLGLGLALVFSVIPAYRAGRTDPVEGFGG